jgi:hypothetical protein
MRIISRKRAVKFDLEYYFTGKPCKRGHICKRRVKDYYCTKCIKEGHHKKYYRAWRAENPNYNQTETRRKSNRLNKRKQRKTSLGILKENCRYVSRTLGIGKTLSAKYSCLDYSHEKFTEHLLKDLPGFSDIKQAYESGYHLDHIVPLSFISSNVKDEILLIRVSMDLYNLRLIPAKENISKNDKINLSITQETIKLLNDKYNINMPLL